MGRQTTSRGGVLTFLKRPVVVVLGLLVVIATVFAGGASEAAVPPAMVGSPTLSSPLSPAVPVPAGISAGAPKGSRFTVTSALIAGETAVAAGKLGARGRRVVLIEQKGSGGWRRVARTSARRNGSFRVAFTATRSAKVRARAPKKGHRHAIKTRSRQLRLVAQSGALAVPGVVLRTQQATMTATFTPARPGRIVTLLGWSSGRWATIASGAQDRGGRTTFTVLAGKVGTFLYRAVTARSAGAPAFSTSSRSMRINEFAVKLSPDAHPLTSTEQGSVSGIDLSTGQVTFQGAAAPQDLAVGDLISLAPGDGAPSGALVRVTGVTSTGNIVTAQTKSATLAELVETMPTSEGTVAMCPVDTQVTDTADGVTLDEVEPAGSCSTALPTGQDTARAQTMAAAGVVELGAPKIKLTTDMTAVWSPVAGVTADWGLEGTIEAAPVVEVGLETNWRGQVTGYHAGGGVDWDNKLTSRAKVTGSLPAKSENDIDLVKVSRTFGGFVGLMPVWADLEGKLVAKVGVEGSVEVAYVNETSGRDLAGIENTSASDLTPKTYSTHATTAGRFNEVTATGKATGSVGAELQLSLYSVGGPYLNLGGKAEIAASWSTATGTACALDAGPYVRLGLQTSDLLKKLTGGTQGFKVQAGAEVWVKLLHVRLCPAGTDLNPDPNPTPTAAWLSISNQLSTTCGIRSDKTGWCWGANTNGLVGDGTTTDRSTPTRLPGTWNTIDNDMWTACGVRSDSTGWCWGDNTSGQVGNGTFTDRGTPTQLPGTWNSLDVDAYTTCGVRSDNTGWCWGDNTYGAVGDGTNANRSTPTQLPGTWKTIDVADVTTCGIRSDNTGWCWGYNNYGAVGDGTNANRSTPTQLPGTWNRLATNSITTCGIRNDTTGWCWGSNGSGSVGDGTTTDRTTPTQLPGTWKSLDPGLTTSCGIRRDTTGWCWGYNADGEVGNGTTTDQTTPTQLPGTWSTIDNSSWTTCGIRSDRTGYCWGANTNGQVGDGATADRTTPTQLPGTWNSLDAGLGTSCGTHSDATGWCWGYNADGQVGDGSTADRRTPTAISTGP